MTNWYRLAKNQAVFTPEDIYAIYSMRALPEKDLDRKLFEALAAKLNNIREYYLDYLTKAVAKELQHILPPDAAIDIDEAQNNPYVTIPTYKEWNKRPNLNMDYETAARNTDIKFNSNVEKRLHNAITQYQQGTPTNSAKADAVFCFNELPWESSYGGPLWAKIAEWTHKLYATPPIKLSGNKIDKKQYDQLLYIIDTINSLHHNTERVLNNLPHGEGKWLTSALEIIKYMPSDLGLAYLANNPTLTRALKQEKMLSTDYAQQPQTIQEAISQMMNKMTQAEKYKLLYTASPIVAQKLLQVPGLDLTPMLDNINVIRHSDLLLKILEYILHNQGIEPLIYAIKYSLFRDGIIRNPAVYDFLKSLNDPRVKEI